MDYNRKCIFHIPNKIDKNGNSASQIRPKKMAQAFRNIGYDVDVIMGYGAERKKMIDKIKRKICNGEKYDFLYSESSTMPTLLTEKNHLPLYPRLDFSFFSFCKKNGIPIGLFYRDIFWKFPEYKYKVSIIKYFIAILAYKYDLTQYNKILDKFYLANEKVIDYINYRNLRKKSDILFPGAECKKKILLEKNIYYNYFFTNNNILSLFYVGGIGGNYKFIKLLEGIYDLKWIKLTICCRQDEWENVKNQYKIYLTDRIKIIHESGESLEKYYKESTICMAFFEWGEYMSLAMPVKIFEYLTYVTPIIATKNTSAGKFVTENDIGWSIEYDVESLRNLLEYLHFNSHEILEKHQNAIQVLKQNTWEKRAEKVKSQLSFNK